MCKALKKPLNLIKEFFKTESGREVASVAMSAGIKQSFKGLEDNIRAEKLNNSAERIKENAIEKYEKEKKIIENTLAKLGETKLAIYESFGELADAIESIQNRPDFALTVGDIDLPKYEPADFKKISTGIEAVTGGLTGMAAGSAVGVAAMGTGTILALAPGALVGGVVFAFMGAKRVQRSAETVQMARDLEKEVDDILKFFKDLDETAKSFHDSFLKIQDLYNKYVHKVQKIICRKTNWDNYSKPERLAVKNAVSLAQLLSYMCSVQLVLKVTEPGTLEKVNKLEVNRTIEDAENVYANIKNGIAA